MNPKIHDEEVEVLVYSAMWIITFYLIAISWNLLDMYGNTGWTRAIVGMANSANGIASFLVFKSLKSIKKLTK